jgi:hypothetical protein
MTEQKLNLLQFSSGEVTQPRATPAKIMGSEAEVPVKGTRQVRDSSTQCRSLHNMLNGFGHDVVPPNRAGSADSAKDEACRYSTQNLEVSPM